MVVAATQLPSGEASHRQGRRAEHPAPATARKPAATPQELSLASVERAFAASYGAYLDGAPAESLHDASITATAQAQSAGRIPPAFRDGQLTITSMSGVSTAYSALASIVLANREQSYPFAVQLLREQHGWEIAQVQPADLSVDDKTRPPIGVAIPPAARRAARRFALAYAAYRVGVAPLPPGMSAAAAMAVRQGQDSLSGVRLGVAAPRLVSLTFGALNEGEFAVTATVRFGVGDQQFSLLMQLQEQTGGWSCAAFL